MTAQRSHHRSRHWLAAGQAGVRLGRLATVLAAALVGLLASAAAATAAFANPVPYGDGGTIPIAPAPVGVISAGGMAGWQVALIVAGAALAAAAAAVLLDRKLVGRRGATATTG